MITLRCQLTLTDGTTISGPIQGSGGVISRIAQLQRAIHQAKLGRDTGLYQPKPGFCRVYPSYGPEGNGAPVDVDLRRVTQIRVDGNPNDPIDDRIGWLRWQISHELATSIAPGLSEGSESATRVLVGWLIHDRERLISHCHGAMTAEVRYAGIEPFTRDEIAHEIDLVAWTHKVSKHPNSKRSRGPA